MPLPGLRALTGPPLVAVVLAAALLLLGTRARPQASWVFLVVVLAVHLAAAWRVHVQVGPNGDEPQYLMVADSLLRDGDLAVEADFEEGRYRGFHPGPLKPHYLVRGREGVIYSQLGVGLSLLILPAYALGRGRGGRAVHGARDGAGGLGDPGAAEGRSGRAGRGARAPGPESGRHAEAPEPPRRWRGWWRCRRLSCTSRASSSPRPRRP